MGKFEHLPGLMLLLQAVACNGQCQIKLVPSTVFMRHGDPVSVRCTVSDEDHYGIGWEASEGSVGLQTGAKFVTWKMEALTDWKIRPRFFENFSTVTGQCTETLNVAEFTFPDGVSITIGPTEVLLVEGNQYSLVCEVTNVAPVRHLTVRWYKGERELDNITFYNDASKTPKNVLFTLLITPTSADDGEQYLCVAELDLGPEGPQAPLSITSDSLEITVHYKPFFMCPKHVVLREGESLDTLSACRPQGNPSPTVTWSRDGSEFNSSTPLTRRDSGRYLLTAKNSRGTSGYALNVTVLYKPLISACPKHKKLHEGESLDTLDSCAAEGNPSPEVTWYRDQSRFNSSTPLIRRDSAQYTLIANNSFGTANHTLEIEVLYKPLITDCPEHVRLREGESLDTVVVCGTEGNPTPTVIWYRNQSQHKSSTPLTRKDGGLYTFSAKNTLGTANHRLDVEILYKPWILECPEHVTLKKGESLNTSVSCRADGNPLPMVTWYRDQSEFDSSTPLTERDGGQYIFMAKNSLGIITKTVNLTLSHSPNSRGVCVKPVRFTLFIIISMINFFCM